MLAWTTTNAPWWRIQLIGNANQAVQMGRHPRPSFRLGCAALAGEANHRPCAPVGMDLCCTVLGAETRLRFWVRREGAVRHCTTYASFWYASLRAEPLPFTCSDLCRIAGCARCTNSTQPSCLECKAGFYLTSTLLVWLRSPIMDECIPCSNMRRMQGNCTVMLDGKGNPMTVTDPTPCRVL